MIQNQVWTKPEREVYSPRAQEVIFVAFFLRPAALKMLLTSGAPQPHLTLSSGYGCAFCLAGHKK